MSDHGTNPSAGTLSSDDLDPTSASEAEPRRAPEGQRREDPARPVPGDVTAGRSAGTPWNAEQDPTRGRSAGTPSNAEQDPTRGSSAGRNRRRA